MIKHRNRISKETNSRDKKKAILQKMKNGLQDFDAKQNYKLQIERQNLINKQNREKQKAEYEASITLTEEKQKELDIYFNPIAQADPIERVKMVFNFLDTGSNNPIYKLFPYFREYIQKICPEFFIIVGIFKDFRKLPYLEQQDVVLNEYLKLKQDA